MAQPDLFAEPAPEGFGYRPELITPADEAELVRRLQDLAFEPFDFHGFKANRQVVSFGSRYDYGRRALSEAEPIPAFLEPLRRKVGEAFDRRAEAFQQVLINAYRPGAGIGWHRDKPQFDEVVGVSLLSACPLRFRRKQGERWERLTVRVAARSAYLLSGPARSVWEHSISPVDALRYSITLRTLR